MPGKLIEINPEVSLHPEQVREVRLSHNWLGLRVITRSGEELEAVPLEGETLEMTRSRLFSAVNDQGKDYEKLVGLAPNLYVDPAKVVSVTNLGNSIRISLPKGECISFPHEEPTELVKAIVSKINAAMRERQAV